MTDNTLILMYVYYDRGGDIKAIMPNSNHEFDTNFQSTMLPLSEVSDFLLGKKNTVDYQVKVTGKSTSLAKLSRKSDSLNYKRTLNNCLTKIEAYVKSENVIIITHDMVYKNFSVELSEKFKDLYENGNEDEQEVIKNLLISRASVLYVTKKNNPYHLLYKFTFLPSELFEKGKLYFSYDAILEDISIYTRKLVEGQGYGFREKRK